LLYESSANNRVRRLGGSVTASANAKATGKMRLPAATFADGAEHDFSGREPPAPSGEFWGVGDTVEFTVSYSQPVPLKTLRLIEGGAHSSTVGYFRTLRPQILVGGTWQDLPAGSLTSAAPTSAPYEIIDWNLPATLFVAAIRLSGATVGGFASIIELDALGESVESLIPGLSSIP
jgi:hypothetical protein